MKLKHLRLPPAPAKLPGSEGIAFYIKDESPLGPEYAARTCTRCGACLQRCPSFKALKSELYSPRGRAQLLKFIFERKLNLKKDKTDILNTSASCLMCGACSEACPAQTPVADLALLANHALLGKRKSKASAAGNFLSKACAARGIKRAAKSQPLLNKEILFLPSIIGSGLIKNPLRIINNAGFKAKINLKAAELDEAYFKADIPKIRAILSALPLKEKTEPASIVTDSIELYAILKKAALFGKDFSPLSKRTRFITEYLKPAAKFKKDIRGKKILLYQSAISPDGPAITGALTKLFICPRNLFLLECIQSKELPSAGASYWTKIKGEKAIEALRSETLNAIDADYLIVPSYADKKLFEELNPKKQGKRLKILHISQIPEEFYDKSEQTSANRQK